MKVFYDLTTFGCFGRGWPNDYRLKNIPNEAAAERRCRNFAVLGEYKGDSWWNFNQKEKAARCGLLQARDKNSLPWQH
jgi:hypothetical protein